MERLAEPLDLGEIFRKTPDSQDGDDDIGRVDHVDTGQDDPAQKTLKEDEGPEGHDRVEDHHHQDHADAPENAELQADVAVKVEGKVTVVPPLHVEQLVEQAMKQKLRNKHQLHVELLVELLMEKKRKMKLLQLVVHHVVLENNVILLLTVIKIIVIFK